MTILTKATDKKKLLPIVTPPITSPSPSAPHDAEAAEIHARHQARAKTTTCLVCLMAILVLLMGILAGVCFYRQYIRERVQRLNCFIPYSDREVDSLENTWVNQNFRDGPTDQYTDALRLMQNDLEDDDDDDDSVSSSRYEVIRNLLNDFFNQMRSDLSNPIKDIRSMESEIGNLDEDTIRNRWFKEEVEVKDDQDDSYADISVPDFKDGRRGRFIHDFMNNQTTIVDDSAKRCFIYPLDYATTLPPQSIIDVFTKMQSGYYFPDTTTLNKKMRVVLPKLEIDDDYVSARTAFVCADKRIYRLEPIVSGVYKRSIAEPLGEEGKFANFVGKIVKVDLENIHEVQAYENN